MKITVKTNFMRIFELPIEYPRGFCHSGGKPVVFVMVDWFNPYPEPHLLPKRLSLEEAETLRNEIRDFIRSKNYFVKGHQYLVVTDYGDAFIIR